MINVISVYKIGQWYEFEISTGNTDGLVLKHQGNSNHKAEYAPIHFPPFMCLCSSPGSLQIALYLGRISFMWSKIQIIFKLFRPNGVYMCHWIGLQLVQEKESLPEPNLTWNQQTTVKFQSKYKIFFQIDTTGEAVWTIFTFSTGFNFVFAFLNKQTNTQWKYLCAHVYVFVAFIMIS